MVGKNERISNCLKFYFIAITLKTKIRQGWINWNISAERLESISEHIYGTCMLAISVCSEFESDIDIEKVVFMLVLHEIEEIKIGDITPYDNISKEEKRISGKQAVEEIFSGLIAGKKYQEYIEEFELKSSNEAKFAFLCDKLECDLQAKRYCDEGNAKFENVDSKILSDKRVISIMDAGAKTVADIFIEYDKIHYKGTIFEDIINFLQEIDTTKIV